MLYRYIACPQSRFSAVFWFHGFVFFSSFFLLLLQYFMSCLAIYLDCFRFLKFKFPLSCVSLCKHSLFHFSPLSLSAAAATAAVAAAASLPVAEVKQMKWK